MSTKTEPYQKYVAHDEKSKVFTFRPEIERAYGKHSNVVGFFSWNIVKKSYIPTVPRLVKNTQNFNDSYPIINFAFFNLEHDFFVIV